MKDSKEITSLLFFIELQFPPISSGLGIPFAISKHILAFCEVLIAAVLHVHKFEYTLHSLQCCSLDIETSFIEQSSKANALLFSKSG
jgi:hypothetical protein